MMEEIMNLDHTYKQNETIESIEPSEQTRPQSRRISFDEQDHLTTGNLSAYWIPELTIQKTIHGTTYTVTGSYEGTESFTRKLERIMARSFTTEVSEIIEESEE